MLGISTRQIIAEVRWRAAALDPGLRRMILEMAERLEILDQVDAIPVVRCKDCLHKRKYGRKPPKCYCMLHEREQSLDGFCDQGERMPDNPRSVYQRYTKEKYGKEK